MSSELLLKSSSPARTAAIGRSIGQLADGGLTIALIGPLGAGKTHLTQGIASGLGVEEPLSSPTFLLHRQYEGRLRLHHFDFYRLDTEDDLESIGFYDFAGQSQNAVIVVEWAEKFPQALEPPVLEVRISPRPNRSRLLALTANGLPTDWLDTLARTLDLT